MLPEHRRLTVQFNPFLWEMHGERRRIHAADQDVRASEETCTALDEAYQSGKLPLSVLSTDQGGSYLDAYGHATTLPRGLLVEDGSVESIARGQEAARLGESVVLHISSLITLGAIDMLHLPNKMFDTRDSTGFAKAGVGGRHREDKLRYQERRGYTCRSVRG